MQINPFEFKQLYAMAWFPDNEPRAILQITHGMTEHIMRYEPLAKALTSHGIAVVGYDLRGHGHNHPTYQVAYFKQGEYEQCLEDIHDFRHLYQTKYPQLPYYMLGFSLGSFLMREYLNHNAAGLAGAIIAGTGNQPKMILRLMEKIVLGQVNKYGYEKTTPLVQKLSFESYNNKFKPNRTASDWLCADEKALDTYIQDPLCKESISSGLFYELIKAMQRTCGTAAYTHYPKDLPILILSGCDDPVGNAMKGVEAFKKELEKAGLNNIELHGYAHARHDIFHEIESEVTNQVHQTIINWLL